MELLVKTLAGLEEVLAQELTTLGAQDIQIHKRAVTCQGNEGLLYRANLWLRSALRVLVPVHRFTAENEQDIYHEVRTLDWQTHMRVDQTLAVDAVTQSANLNHSHYLALKVKDAVADWFRDNTGRRPSVDVQAPDLRLHLHIDSLNQCTLLLDSSGDGLHRRGYRTAGGPAPLNEVLAAGMVLLSGWQPGTPLVDMMCGSGTLLVEAGLMARNLPPGRNRKYGFQTWLNFDENLWSEVRREARDLARPNQGDIRGLDISRQAISLAQANADAAGLGGLIRFRAGAFQQFSPPLGPGTLISNPPYDLRVASEDINRLYADIGDRLKQAFSGYTAWLLSGNMEALKHIGLRPSRKIPLMNGQLECKFQRYDLYAGSKKDRFEAEK